MYTHTYRLNRDLFLGRMICKCGGDHLPTFPLFFIFGRRAVCIRSRSNRTKFHQFLAYRNFPPQQAVYINPLAVDAFAVQRVAVRGESRRRRRRWRRRRQWRSGGRGPRQGGKKKKNVSPDTSAIFS